MGDMSDVRLPSRQPGVDPRDLRAWIDRLPVGAVWTDGRRLAANAPVEEIVGWPRSELTTLDAWFERLYGPAAAEHRGYYEADRAAGFPAPIRVRLTRRDGATRLVEFRAISDEIGEVWLLQDRTDDEAAGDLARTLDGVLRKVSAHVPGVLYQFLARRDGTFAFPFATQSIRYVYGVEPAQVREDAGPVFAVIHPDDLDGVTASIERSRATLTVWRDTFRVAHPERGTRWMHGESSPEALPNGDVLWHGYISDVTDLRATQQALSVSEEYLQHVFSATEAAIFVVDVEPDGGFRYVGSNAAHARASGIASADLAGRTPRDLLPPDLAGAVEARYRACVDGGVPVTYEEELTLPVPGTWYRTSLVPVRNGGARVVRLVGSGFDITDLRRAEQELRDREVLLEKAQRAGRLGFWSLDVAAGVATWSGPAEAILGSVPTEGAVEHFRARVAEDGRRLLDAQRDRAIEHGAAEATFRFRTDGGMRWVRMTAERTVDDAGHLVLVGTVQDVDDAHRREAEVARLATIVEQAPAVVMLTDVAGTIEYVNRHFERTSGYAAHEVVGRPAGFLSADAAADEAAARRMWAALAADGTWVGTFENRRRDGSRYRERATVSAIVDAGGRISHYLKLAEDVTEREELAERVAYLSENDPLTGLPNRAVFARRTEEAVAGARRHGDRLAVLMLDVDAFSTVNDGLGHGIGDALLVEVAARLRARVRRDDVVARVGGDEFAVLLDRLERPLDVGAAVAQVRAAFREPIAIDGHRLPVSLTIGVAVFPGDAETADELQRHADVALYRAKAIGPDATAHFTETMNAELQERVRLDAALRDGLARGELRLVYQPRVDMASGRVASLEALARWRSPEFGDVPPTRFIEVAEASGFIRELGEWVVRTAAHQQAAFRDAGLRLVPIAVNLSVRQFQHEGLVGMVRAALDETGVPAGLFEVEITESTAMTDVAATVDQIRALEQLGVAVSIDDFGTAHSSLGRLKALAVRSLKIDRSFIADLGDDPEAAPHDAAIVRAMIAIGDALALDVIAEGVENRAQRDFLLRHGCRLAQGYLFARPGEADEVARWLAVGRVPA
jgi:diguanylate cyclase (GGDEF)-like protein/PAS domain S-box-containing protein